MTKTSPTFREKLMSNLAWTTGLLTFGVLGTIVVLLSLIIDPKRFDGFVKASCRLILRSLFIRIRVEGLEHVPTERACLFMSNHVNIFDVFVLFGYIPGMVRGVELDEHFTWLFYGRIIRRLGMIPISQTDARAAIKSLQRAKNALAAGTSIVILPEGGRTLTGHFQPFKRGSFLLAKQAGVDIVPMVMVNAFRIKQKGISLIRPGTMTVRFGQPIRYDDISDLKTNDILMRVQQNMREMFEKPTEITPNVPNLEVA